MLHSFPPCEEPKSAILRLIFLGALLQHQQYRELSQLDHVHEPLTPSIAPTNLIFNMITFFL